MNKISQSIDPRRLLAGLENRGSLSRSGSPALQAIREARRAESLEVVFLSDATESMTPYIESVKQQFSTLMADLARRHPGIGFAAGFYRDEECQHPFDLLPEFFTQKDLARVQSFLDQRGFCEGNHTYVEAMGAGIFQVTEYPWTAEQRVLVHCGDHPSHGYEPLNRAFVDEVDTTVDNCRFRLTHADIVAHLKRRRIRAYMVRCDDLGVTREQYERIAHATGGRFIDFDALTSPSDLCVVIQAAVAHAAGRDVAQVIAESRSRAQIGDSAATALLECFTDNPEAS